MGEGGGSGQADMFARAAAALGAARDAPGAATSSEAELLRQVVDGAPIVLWAVDRDGIFTLSEGQALTRLGLAPGELTGRSIREVYAQHPEILELVDRALGGETTTERTTLGDVAFSSWQAPLHGPDGEVTGVLGIATDISEQVSAETKLTHLADHDGLTGLFNQRRFGEELDRHAALASRYGQEGAVLVVDLDALLVVNDSLGRAAGDALIQGVAALLSDRMRETDIVARLGGDAFGILLAQCDAPHAYAVAASLRDAIRDFSLVLDGHTVRATVSIGLALLGVSHATGEELLASAEVAAIEASEAGGDRIVVHSRDSSREAISRLSWVERIRDALQHDHFAAYAQPILDLQSGQVSQYELLVRMIDRDGLVIAPNEFLGVAERYGLIQPIDRWMVTQAIRLIAAEAAEGRKLVLEVNLSGRSVDDPELPRLLERELRESGIDPSHLIFEITETAAISNMDDARRFADTMTALGCRFALDDFGTGFGSFFYLKHLPLHYLKIDGDFIRALPRSHTDQLVAKALVQIAEGLGVKTVAEYVGDEETCSLLREFGVDFAQGYHVGRPAPMLDLISPPA